MRGLHPTTGDLRRLQLPAPTGDDLHEVLLECFSVLAEVSLAVVLRANCNNVIHGVIPVISKRYHMMSLEIPLTVELPEPGFSAILAQPVRGLD